MKKLISLALLFISILVHAQDDRATVIETVNKASIEGHIYFLADDLLKGRETGTPENKIAASYLANTLRGYGVKPNPKTGNFYQTVKLKKTSPPANTSLILNGQALDKFVILNAKDVAYDDTAVYMGHGLEDDYIGQEVNGKIVLVKAGGPDAKDTRAAFGLREEKQKLAQQAGAIGVIEFLDAQSNIWNYIEHNFNEPNLQVDLDENSTTTDSDLAYAWVLDSGNLMTDQLSNNRSNVVKLNLEDEISETIVSQNVIGMVEGTDPVLKNEFIIYSAHYDHVGIGTPDESGDTIYNGARDNAVGTTTVLSMAQNLAKYPTKRSALFILFTGEEKGLLGSKYYVENPVLPLDKMVYCFNSDNAGYNDTSLVTIVGLPRTTAENHIKEAALAFGLTAVDDPAPEQGLFDRSDNVHFAAKGIPAPTFSLGFTAFNGDVTKYYHRPSDEADSIDYEYLEKFFKAYVLAGRAIGNDPITPKWTTGDKYEKASKQLYKNREKN